MGKVDLLGARDVDSMAGDRDVKAAISAAGEANNGDIVSAAAAATGDRRNRCLRVDELLSIIRP